MMSHMNLIQVIIMGKTKFSSDWHRKVAELIKVNWTIIEIAKNLKVNPATVSKSVRDYSYLVLKDVKPVCFGHKSVAYLTEEEMLEGYKIPKYKELSKSEKQIYDEKEKRSN